MASKIKALQQWCQKMAEGYPNVNISNFTTAWRDGLAFCAIIHRFRPDLIDFDSLSSDNVFENCKMAFEIAERELSIPAFLEAEDMVRLKTPDKLSIITYVSQYYNFLHSLPQLGGPGIKGKVINKPVSGTKRPTDSDTLQAPIIKKASTSETKENSAPAKEKSVAGGDKCGICQNHVYLLERHIEGGKLYHRSCFRHSELSPANKVYTRSPFLSSALSSETKSSTSLSTDNKSSILSGVGNSSKVNNFNSQTKGEPAKATSEISFASKKLEGAALKHPIDEPGREDAKKSKMQPRTLFGDEKSNQASAIKDKIGNHEPQEYFDIKSSKADKSLPLSSKEAHKLEKRQNQILASEKTPGDLPKNIKMNMPLIFQQKDTPKTDTSKSISFMPTSVTVGASTKTSNSVLPSQSVSSIDQSKNKLLGSKDIQKPSEETKTVFSKTSALPSVQNLQKVFGGNLNEDSSEPTKPAHPIARPRSGTLKTVSEESGKDSVEMKPKIAASAEEKNKDNTPKPAPRKSMLETSEATFTPKQLETLPQNKKYTLSTESADNHVVTSSLVPSLKKNDSGVLSGLLTSLAGIRGQVSSSPGPTNQTSQFVAKIPTSTPSSNMKTENSIISSTKAPIDKKVGVTTTPSSLHSVTQKEPLSVSKDTRNSTQSVVNTHGFQAKSNADKTIMSQGHKDSIASMNTTNLQTPNKIHGTLGIVNSTNTTNLQTPNKVHGTLGIVNSKTPVSSITALTPTNQSSNTNVKVSRPEKVNSECSNVHTDYKNVNKQSATSRVPSNNTNHNIGAVSTSSNLHILKDSENKSNGTSKTDFNQSRFKLASTNQSISVDESKSLSSIKSNIVSSSKEDILDRNAIKLKSVMPERKEVKKESKAAMYDVKLKKVDVIKGDTKWESPAEKLQKNASNDKFVSGDINGGRGMVQTSHGLSSGPSQSSVTAPQKINVSIELPQWKKDIDDRKNLRDKITQPETETGQFKHLKGKDDKKAIINSESNIGLANNKRTSENQSSGERAISLHKKPAETLSVESDSVKNIGTKKNGRKLSPTRGNQGNDGKLDWQLEAEKRRAAIRGFDMEVVGKLKETEKPNLVSLDIPANHQTKKNPYAHKSEADLSKINDKGNSHLRKYNVDLMMGGDSIVQNKGAKANVTEKSTAKLKDLELKFVLNKSMLKPVEVDISSSPEEEIEKPFNDQPNINHENNGKGEDFRHMLHQLKHVPTAEYGKLDLSKLENGTGMQRDTCDIAPFAVTKPSLNVNKNNNDKLFISEQANISDEHFQKLDKNGQTPVKTFGLQGSADENGNIRKMYNSEQPNEKLILEKVSRTNEKNNEITNTPSKVLRKVDVQDKHNKVAVVSPPSSPKLKKIQVTTKFDFENSSDFEQSLTESTAKLTIQDKHIPPVRPPPPRTNLEMQSPSHISVIELQTQLLNIDSRLTELEQRGRQLEESIRNVNSHEDDDDELMIEWFSLINEKNDLVRKEADLIYMSREQELESEQELIESQLRYLLSKPDECKSPEEKQEEEYLIKHKVELVEQRNMIVDSMDDDRIRYKAEDQGIEVVLKRKGYWKDSTGTLKALKGKKVAKSVFYT